MVNDLRDIQSREYYDPGSAQRSILVDGSGNIVNSSHPLSTSLVGIGSVYDTVPSTFLSTGNTTTGSLAPNGSFVGATESVLPYSEITLNLYGTPSNAAGSLFFEFSPDGVNWDVSVPFAVTDPTSFVPQPLRVVLPYYRVRYNNGTTQQTAFRLTNLYHREPAKHLTRFVTQTIGDGEPIEMTRSVTVGKNPSGAYVNLRSDGLSYANSTTSAIAANGSYFGQWENIVDYNSVSVLVNNSVNSQTDGFRMQFSSDSGATVHSEERASYTSAGTRKFIAAAVEAPYFRVGYYNGTSAANTVNIQTSFHTAPIETAKIAMTDSVTDTILGNIVRAGIVARNDAGNWNNVTMDSGLRVSVIEHETTTPIRALTGIKVTRVTVPTSSTALPASNQSGRKSISIKALTTNNKSVFIGHNSSVSTSTGYELAAGDAVVMEVDDTATVYGIADTSSQGVAIIEVS